jgi:hypothetical protein
MGTLALPALAFVFTLLLVGYSVWDLDQLSGPGPGGLRTGRALDKRFWLRAGRSRRPRGRGRLSG